MPLLNSEQLAQALSLTSPYSLPHNIAKYRKACGAEAVTSPKSPVDRLRPLTSMLRTGLDKVQNLPLIDPEHPEDRLTDLALALGEITVGLYSYAAGLGIHLEDVTEAVVASLLTDSRPHDLVATILFGVSE